MTATMTYVGLDVHACSTHAARSTSRAASCAGSFGGGSEEVIGVAGGRCRSRCGLLRGGPDGVRALPCGRGGRVARGGGRAVEDAARAGRPDQDRPQGRRAAGATAVGGAVKLVAVPGRRSRRRAISLAPEQVRGDLMRGRHRVSKLLLLHGRVYRGERVDEDAPALAGKQRFDEAATSCLPRRARCRRRAGRPQDRLDERLSRLAREGEWWPTVAGCAASAASTR